MKIISNAGITAYTRTVETSKAETENKPENTAQTKNTDTFTISVEGKKFRAEKTESNTDMFSMRVDDIEGLREALNSAKPDYSVNWRSTVDPFGDFYGAAFVESKITQLNDPNASRNVNDTDRIAKEYADKKLDELAEKKKAISASETHADRAKEYEEYRKAYDAYHSENGKDLISSMSGDMKKAYSIYKNILDGKGISRDEAEYLSLYHNMMYLGAKGEVIRKSDEMMSAKNR